MLKIKVFEDKEIRTQYVITSLNSKDKNLLEVKTDEQVKITKK